MKGTELTNEEKYRDLKYVVPSVVLAICIVLMSYGLQAGVYLMLLFMCVNAFFMVLTAAIQLNSDILPTKQEKPVYRNPLMQFMMHVISFLALYQTYIIGYVFFTGFMSFMVVISFVSNLISTIILSSRSK